MSVPSPSTERYGTLSVFDFETMPLDWTDTLSKDELFCRRVEPGEAEAVQDLMHQAGDYEAGDVARRLEIGREGYVGEIALPDSSERRMVTYGWVALDTEPLGNSGYAFQPHPGDAWLYDFATPPAYRGRGYYPTLLRYILKDLAKQGVKRAWIGTAPGNDVSARSIARAGFKLVATVHLKFGPDGRIIGPEARPAPGVDLLLYQAGMTSQVKLSDI